jgi:hypothetical protein
MKGHSFVRVIKMGICLDLQIRGKLIAKWYNSGVQERKACFCGESEHILPVFRNLMQKLAIIASFIRVSANVCLMSNPSDFNFSNSWKFNFSTLWLFSTIVKNIIGK